MAECSHIWTVISRGREGLLAEEVRFRCDNCRAVVVAEMEMQMLDRDSTPSGVTQERATRVVWGLGVAEDPNNTVELEGADLKAIGKLSAGLLEADWRSR